MPSPTRSAPERRSPEPAGRQRHHLDEPHGEAVPSGSEPVQGEDRPIEGAVVLDSEMEVEMTTESFAKGKDRSDNRDGELPGKAESPGRTDSPLEFQQQLMPALETVAMPSNEAAVTTPYLPTIPRYEAKPRFSAAYESEASLSD